MLSSLLAFLACVLLMIVCLVIGLFGNKFLIIQKKKKKKKHLVYLRAFYYNLTTASLSLCNFMASFRTDQKNN